MWKKNDDCFSEKKKKKVENNWVYSIIVNLVSMRQKSIAFRNSYFEPHDRLIQIVFNFSQNWIGFNAMDSREWHKQHQTLEFIWNIADATYRIHSMIPFIRWYFFFSYVWPLPRLKKVRSLCRLEKILVILYPSGAYPTETPILIAPSLSLSLLK